MKTIIYTILESIFFILWMLLVFIEFIFYVAYIIFEEIEDVIYNISDYFLKNK